MIRLFKLISRIFITRSNSFIIQPFDDEAQQHAEPLLSPLETPAQQPTILSQKVNAVKLLTPSSRSFKLTKQGKPLPSSSESKPPTPSPLENLHQNLQSN